MICRNYSLSGFFRAVYRPQHLNLSDQGAGNIARDLRRLDEWAGSPVLLADLSDSLVLEFLRYRQLQGDSAPTLNGRRAKILAVWRYARRLRYVRRGPRHIPKLKEPYRLPQAWTIVEVERLLTHSRRLTGRVGEIPKRLFWPALEQAIYWTGCRPKALLAAKAADFNPDERSLVIRAANDKTNRDVFYTLHPQCVAALVEIWDPARDLLFPWPHCPRYFWTCFRRIVEAAGLPSGKEGRQLFYRLRRTNLSYCAAVDERIAQAQAGHASFRTTLKYIDPRIGHSRSAADVLPVPSVG